MQKFLLISLAIGLLSLQSGDALKCKICKGNCTDLNQSEVKVAECSLPTTEPPSPEPSTSSSGSSSSGSSSTEASSTEPSSTEKSSTEPSSTEASSTEKSSTEKSSTKSSSTETSSTEPSSTEASNSTNIFLAYFNNRNERKRRSLLGRFSSEINARSNDTDFLCYTIKNNQQEITEMGCTTTDANICNNSTNCNVCKEDGCNSATSNAVFASMVFSLSIIIFFMK
ncbi:cell wall protein RBR3-like [Apis dorsata]|uniref:cell wall protein RBR3-like n=1 Tax=Apis dorsata TaxID=7462 RepID=UPI001293EDB3|nr:cell wall protein RBR3-like [Apis dorsata]